MTDNKNRTVAEVRHLLSKYGGNLGSNGCVAWMFEKTGVITIELDAIDEDTLMEIVSDAGAKLSVGVVVVVPEGTMFVTSVPISILGDKVSVTVTLSAAPLPWLSTTTR